MFKIQIKNLQNVVTHQAELASEQLCLDWMNSVKLTGAFGKIERRVKEISEGVLENNEDISKSVSVEEHQEIDGIVKIHTLPQEFSYSVTDISSQRHAEQESYEAAMYLKSTDWLIIREMDSGEPCPSEIKALRAAARLKVL